jgi:integrase
VGSSANRGSAAAVTPRRGSGEGSIFKRKDGRWASQLDFGWINGRRRRRLFYGLSRQEVQSKLTAAAHDWQRGKMPPVQSLTVEQFLTQWLERIDVAPLTRESYEEKTRLHIIPVIGKIRLIELTPRHVEDLLQAKDEVLSPRSLHTIRAVLRTALSRAQRWGYVERNVAALATSPKVRPYEAAYLTVEQAKSFLAAARRDRLSAMYCVAMAMGLRQGELLGLRWQDVDLETGMLSVRKALKSIRGQGLVLMDTKTPKSRRTLVMPEFVRDELRQHRSHQIEERLLAGSLWSNNDLVFCTALGNPLEASNVLRRSFHNVCRNAGIAYSTKARKALRFHDLRTSAATIMLAVGLPDRVVMETLGHSNLGMTAHYQHVPSSVMADAAQAMNRALG